MKKFLATVSIAAVGVSSAFAEGIATLPETGVDVAGFITQGITVMGGIAAVALGGTVAFMCVRKGIGWIRKAF